MRQSIGLTETIQTETYLLVVALFLHFSQHFFLVLIVRHTELYRLPDKPSLPGPQCTSMNTRAVRTCASWFSDCAIAIMWFITPSESRISLASSITPWGEGKIEVARKT